jgi:hypothetical protein
MSDRGALFLFSLIVIVACLVVAVWLIANGQARYIDGLFLMLSCLVVAFAFGLYVRYIIMNAMTGTRAAATEKAPAAVPEKAAPAVPGGAGQLAGKAR